MWVALCLATMVVASAPAAANSEVFQIDRAENKVTLRTETPDPELRARVELAVRHCPTRALSIEE